MTGHSNHAGDMLREIEARIAFLNCAALAFTVAEEPMLPDNKAWLGFYYFTGDLLEMTTHTNTLYPLA